MNIENPNPYGAINVAHLEEFEKTIGTRLPEDYRSFLLESNGGKPEKRAFMAPEDPLEEEGEWSERELVGLYSLHNQDVPKSRDTMSAFKLNEAWQDLQNDVPGTTLPPIGQDWSGNYICLQLSRDHFGEVCFFDHEFEVETNLADSFDEFVERLTESTEDTDEGLASAWCEDKLRERLQVLSPVVAQSSLRALLLFLVEPQKLR